MIRTALITLIAVLVIAGSARAETVPLAETAPWPVMTVEADGLVYSAQASADAWWHAHNVVPCPGPVFSFPGAGQYSTIGGLGTLKQDGCDATIRYAINANVVSAARRALGDADVCQSRSQRRRALTILWVTVAHERGHNAGLGHSATGVMQIHGATNAPPRAAEAWAKRLLPGRDKPNVKVIHRNVQTATVTSSGCG